MIPRHLRPPKRDRLPNTPDPYEMPEEEREDAMTETEQALLKGFAAAARMVKEPLMDARQVYNIAEAWKPEGTVPRGPYEGAVLEGFQAGLLSAVGAL